MLRPGAALSALGCTIRSSQQTLSPSSHPVHRSLPSPPAAVGETCAEMALTSVSHLTLVAALVATASDNSCTIYTGEVPEQHVKTMHDNQGTFTFVEHYGVIGGGAFSARPSSGPQVDYHGPCQRKYRVKELVRLRRQRLQSQHQNDFIHTVFAPHQSLLHHSCRPKLCECDWRSYSALAAVAMLLC